MLICPSSHMLGIPWPAHCFHSQQTQASFQFAGFNGAQYKSCTVRKISIQISKKAWEAMKRSQDRSPQGQKYSGGPRRINMPVMQKVSAKQSYYGKQSNPKQQPTRPQEWGCSNPPELTYHSHVPWTPDVGLGLFYSKCLLSTLLFWNGNDYLVPL